MSRPPSPLIWGLTALFGCAAPGSDGPVDPGDAPLEGPSLLDHGAWTETAPEDDPWSGHRPEGAYCPQGTRTLEDGALEVQTGYCEYLAIEQPLTVDLPAGQPLRLVLWHDTLVFDEPAQAHVALAVDSQVLWQAHVSIPSAAGVHDVVFEVPEALDAGSTLRFHLHNHGFNTWNLLSLTPTLP